MGRPMVTPGVSVGDVLELIRGRAVVTRADLRRLTGLSRTAVTLRVEQLLDHGLVTERAEGGSTGGRPPARLAFNSESGVVFAVSLGAGRSQVAVCDLAGAVLAESEFATVGRTEQVLVAAADQLDTLREQLPADRVVYGVGVGVPSAVDVATGHSMSLSTGPGRGDIAVAEFLADRFGAPVLVDSDVNVLALAEQARHPEVRDLLVLKASTGIGAGIIAGGRLQRGAWGGAGEIGHIKVAGAEQRQCRCGDRGCLETVAAGWAVLKELADQGKSVANLHELNELVRAGDSDALRLVREAGRRIGEVVAAAVNLLNPAVIVVRGDLSHTAEPLVAGLRERIYQQSSALATRSLRIEPGSAEAPTGVQACAAMILDQVLAAPSVNARLGGVPV
ncbi:ROK family transcriptional regulator [Nocardia sp. alder85J]|uniref:ROK family transcriptional regulator n=1 Tax=Nocardia sp. alder85J TaxID=2862949 RepID=UPI001CD267A9|nr:ROK family protein [Nocardia sp. alder85J]MCX4098248.1 ROK family protein [Nocardia sp. alder85J]